nr:MAG TPA: hypothetical protein [Siphoviridae sp. cte3s7]
MFFPRVSTPEVFCWLKYRYEVMENDENDIETTTIR